MRLREWTSQGACFEDLAGSDHRFTPADLIDLAIESRDPQTGQRIAGHGDACGDPRLAAMADHAAGWRFTLEDGRGFTVTQGEIAMACEPPLWHVPQAAWTGGDAMPLCLHDFPGVLADDEAVRLCLLSVARYGFARLNRAGAQPGAAEALVSRFGAIRETNYGRLFDVIVRPSPSNLADTAAALAPHTDNPYRASPPDLQLLHCIQAACAGGDTRLVDGFAIARHLRSIAPAAFAVLADVPVEFRWTDGQHWLEAAAPVIELGGAARDLARLRWNDRAQARILDHDPERRAAWRRAAALFASCLAERRFVTDFRMAAGEVLIMDNRRVLHGRTAFTEPMAARHLQGAYADIDGLYSTLFRHTAARADGEVARLAAVFDSAAMSEPYGETLSIRDHMLQCAELATVRQLGGDMVTAALLHDIGWALTAGRPGEHHEQAGGEFVAPLFGSGIADPIRLHVAAKRYLVTNRPDYLARLSAASRDTLKHQGGAMKPEESSRFIAEPGSGAALQLRYIDDEAKDRRAPRTHFAAYAPLLNRQILRHLLGQDET